MESKEANAKSSLSPQPENPGLNTWGTILLYLLAVFVFLMLFGGLGVGISYLVPTNYPNRDIVITFINTIALLISTLIPAILFTRYIDNQSLSMLGLSIKGRAKECLYGIIVAILLFVIGFGLSIALGAIEIVSVNIAYGTLFVSLIFFLIAAFVEEVMVRGYILGRLLLKVNKFLALGVSSLIFSLLHFSNPGLGALPLINLFLAGMMFGVYCLYVRNLWFPTFLHAFWNWIQGSVLGYEVSGTNLFSSLFTIRLTGSDLVTGGAFGFEGSIICTMILIATILLMIIWFERKSKIREDNIILI